MEQNVNSQHRRHIIDKVAASVMLQSWLDAGQPLGDETSPDPGTR